MKVLLAIDDSDCSRAAIDSVMHQFRPHDTEVRLVHVDEWPKALASEFAFARGTDAIQAVLAVHEEQRRNAHALVDATKHRLQAAEFRVATDMRVGDARREILSAADEWQPDVIVVGSHGRHGVERLLLGSVSEYTVRHASCSVEVVRPAHE
jgi:nucleotide-binding universal stress UspA family protein